MQIPLPLLQSLKNVEQFDEQLFISAHNNEPIVSIRLNPKKECQHFGNNEKVPWSSQGKYLIQRPSFVADPLWHVGAYYVQEASSMFLEQALVQTTDLSKDLIVLDACASPGGKSTLVSSLLSDNSLLLSNEVIQTRVNTLIENITKWGTVNNWICNNDVKDIGLLHNSFDVVLIDAPCSGSGLFRKDEKAISHWSEANVTMCASRQQRIFSDVEKALCQQGLLVYMTCSYSEQENEAMVDFILQTGHYESLKLNVDKSWQIVETNSNSNKGFGYRFMPHLTKGEGFFLSVFRKKGDYNRTTPYVEKSKKKYQIGTWINDFFNPEHLYFTAYEKSIIAIYDWHENYLQLFSKHLKMVKRGVHIGTEMNKNLIPDHELAMCATINKNIATLEVDYKNAIHFLKRENMDINTDINGWLLVSYENIHLGWAKNIKTRINNYYPLKYRLLRNIF